MTKPLILIVEDNADNSMLAEKVLTHQGLDTVVQADGEAALAWCAHNVPSLIIMDVSLPGMDGLEVTRRLRVLPAFATLPILALTAHALEGWAERTKEAGCTAYLAKPVRPRELAQVVKQYLGLT